METTDPVFLRAVERLKRMAREGALVPELLGAAKADVADHSTTAHALVALHHAFDIPLAVATSLGLWRGFHDNPVGTHGDVLEEDYGELLRARVRD